MGVLVGVLGVQSWGRGGGRGPSRLRQWLWLLSVEMRYLSQSCDEEV
jgi:hypothetical protein